MSGFLSNSQRDTIRQLLGDLHDTFAKSITVYKNGKKTVIASTPSYNAIYRRTNTGSQENVQYSTISETFDARVYYINADEEYFASEVDTNSNKMASQSKILIPTGSVKIVVKQEAYEFIKEARRVELDGNRFSIKSDGLPSGLVGNQFYTFILTPLDEV
jgi:hypothetical protein